MYGGISGLIQWRKNKLRQKEIKDRISFRHSLKRLEAGERDLRNAAQKQRQNAVEAERCGDHAAAVRFALEAKRLEKQTRVTDDMKNTTMTAHAMGENTQALSRMMQAVNEMAGTDPSEIIQMQIKMETVREDMNMMMETAGEALDTLTDSGESQEKNEGEKTLRELMKDEEQKKHRSILVETGKKLDAMMRSRLSE